MGNDNEKSNSKKKYDKYELNKKKFYKLIKDEKTYIISLEYVKNKVNSLLIIKTSQIINQKFFLYEKEIDKKCLTSILVMSFDNMEFGYFELQDVFAAGSVVIKEVKNGKRITLEIKSFYNNSEIQLPRVTKEEKIIISELIEKYSYLENEYKNLEKQNKILSSNNNNRRVNEDEIREIEDERPEITDERPEVEEEIDDNNHITIEGLGSVWSMIKMNEIKCNDNKVLNLVAIGFSNGTLILINLDTMKIHQKIKDDQSLYSVYSLAQFKNEPKFLFCSTSSGLLIVYKLNVDKYEELQKLQKPIEIRNGEINKVITLTSGDLATADRKSVSIWRKKKDIDEFEFFKEIRTNNDTCQLVEVNPNVFACAIYTPRLIQIFNNDGKDFPLIGTISNVDSHGSNSNGMAKINDGIFASAGNNTCIYIVSVDPVQIVQIIKIKDTAIYSTVAFVSTFENKYLYTGSGNEIFQFDIIKDDDNNFVELKESHIFKDKVIGNSLAIRTKDGKLFYQIKGNNTRFYLAQIDPDPN